MRHSPKVSAHFLKHIKWGNSVRINLRFFQRQLPSLLIIEPTLSLRKLQMNANSQLCFCMNRRSFKFRQSSTSKALVQKGRLFFCHLQAKFVKIRTPISYQHWFREYLPDGWNSFAHILVFWLYCLSTVLPAINCML